jgi:signal peptidase I
LRGFSKGDILFIVGVKPRNIHIGDVIIFDAGQSAPVIHRVINITQSNGEYVFSTEGDDNPGQLSVEREINQNQIVGKAVFRIAPFIGWAKLIFYEGQKPVSQRGFCSSQPSVVANG